MTRSKPYRFFTARRSSRRHARLAALIALSLVAPLAFAAPPAVAASPAAAEGGEDPLDALAPPEENASAQTRRARGLLEPRAEAVLSSELPGRIVEMPFEEGQHFKRGATLVRFDCAYYEAQLASARAGLSAAKLELENSRELAALNSIGGLDVALAEAKVTELEAEVAVNRVQTRRCVIKAPFSGRVVKAKAKRFESVNQGGELIEVVDDATPQVRLIVPSRWLSWLTPGVAFDFTIDETGETLRGEVKRIGARIDAVSQTLPVIGAFANPSPRLIAGMSGTARFDGARFDGAGS